MSGLILITAVVTVLAMAVPVLVIKSLLCGVPTDRISPPHLLFSDIAAGLLPPAGLLLGLRLARRRPWAGATRAALVCVSVIAADLGVLCYDLLTTLAGDV